MSVTSETYWPGKRTRRISRTINQRSIERTVHSTGGATITHLLYRVRSSMLLSNCRHSKPACRRALFHTDFRHFRQLAFYEKRFPCFRAVCQLIKAGVKKATGKNGLHPWHSYDGGNLFNLRVVADLPKEVQGQADLVGCISLVITNVFHRNTEAYSGFVLPAVGDKALCPGVVS